MTEEQFLAFVEAHLAFVKAELAHVTREVSELEEYRAGLRTSAAPLGSRFFSNAGHRLMEHLASMERWSITH